MIFKHYKLTKKFTKTDVTPHNYRKLHENGKPVITVLVGCRIL